MRVKSMALMAFLLGNVTSPVDVGASRQGLKLDTLYACMLFPNCDVDIYSPVVKPKDSKTETEDAKDEKLA
jgi:hypothetical protein